MSLLIVSPKVRLKEPLVKVALQFHKQWEVLYVKDGKVILATGDTMDALFSITNTIDGTFVTYFHNDSEERAAYELEHGIWCLFDGTLEGIDNVDTNHNDSWNYADFMKTYLADDYDSDFDSVIVPEIETFTPQDVSVVFVHPNGEVNVVNFQEGFEYKGMWLSTKRFTPEYLEEKKSTDEPVSDSLDDIDDLDDEIDDRYNVMQEDSKHIELFEPEPCDWCKAMVRDLHKVEGDEVCSFCFAEFNGETNNRPEDFNDLTS